MFQYGLCELHCIHLHGGNTNHGHYLLIDTFDPYEQDEDEEDEAANIDELAEWYNGNYEGLNANLSHNLIRNYSQMIHAANYIKPEILKVIELETGEQVVLIKTCWIRIFQRTWRRQFAKRMAKYKNIHHILNRRLNPFICVY